jgi:PKD repeat protein
MKIRPCGHGNSRISACWFFIILMITCNGFVMPGLSAAVMSRDPALHPLNLTTASNPPVASFTADVTTGAAPLTVRFSDASQNSPASWLWDFNGDGRIDSRIQNPQYTYQEPGAYTVTLTVSGSSGKDEEIRQGYIIVRKGTSLPRADFTSDITSGTPPLTVRFTDLSVNDPLAWEWDVNGDGRIDSREQNPSFTYSMPGIYPVRLIVHGKAGSDEKTRADYISVTNIPGAAAPASPVTPEKETITATPTGTTVTLFPTSTANPAVKNPPEPRDLPLFLLLFIIAVLIAAAYLFIRSRSSCSSVNESQELHLELSGGIDYGEELPPLVDPAERVQPGSDRDEGS